MTTTEWEEEARSLQRALLLWDVVYDQMTYYYTPPTMYPRSLTPEVNATQIVPLEDLSVDRAVVYVHIPVCTTRCTFCPFQLDVGKVVSDRYVEALVRQMQMLTERTQISSNFNIFFGGGSPNLLTVGQLQRLIEEIQSNCGGSAKEINVELHPEVASRPGYLRALAEMGVNRVSFGFQTTDPETLRITARHHSNEALANIVPRAKGFDMTVNVDVMYGGFLDETLEMDRSNFEYVLGLDTDWVTGYQVCVQEGTAEATRWLKEQKRYPDTEEMLLARAMLHEMARARGYSYLGGDYFASEASPLVFQGNRWSGRTAVIALGSGSYSYIIGGEGKDLLWWSPFTTEGYLDHVEHDRLPIDRQIIYTARDVESWIVVGKLKTGQKVSGLPDSLSGIVEGLVQHGFLERRNGLRLTSRGILAEDLVCASLLPSSMWRRFSEKRSGPVYTAMEARYDWFFEPDTVRRFQEALRT
jgi:oxygen-independent coproporphyrinogen-3 oxidase